MPYYGFYGMTYLDIRYLDIMCHILIISHMTYIRDKACAVALTCNGEFVQSKGKLAPP